MWWVTDFLSVLWVAFVLALGLKKSRVRFPAISKQQEVILVRHISWRELRGCEIFPTSRRIYTREPHVLKTKVYYHYKLVHSFRSIASLSQEVRYWSSYSNLACAVSLMKYYCLMNATEACTLVALLGLRTTSFGNYSLKAFPYHISEGKQLFMEYLFSKTL